ncbi:hypothetical protein REC12_18100 [Desulfosporosinus sp. PR]|uniref:hypothetical protein n=1 Tax=Candidatus Desulfosporosinus nitrosoreducens TaxID=3401928 RepID=UPI0027F57790|nr:hypothetical protein [Desulfosporosinus sp. PR]MDQ7095503.1 hypothetical protein [Desulfosporosinus sp. PR]
MSRWKVISLILILGLGIGCIAPRATSWWPDKNRGGNIPSYGDVATMSANAPSSQTKVYHFVLKNDVLSVMEGKPGTNGKIIITGLNVHTWPKDILALAPKVEFYSLDEVQSFIDTVNEPLWQE